MKFTTFQSSQSDEIIKLFTEVFSASENDTEGKLIGAFVSNLISTTEHKDLIGFVSSSVESSVGCIFFSRLVVPSGQEAFILSPVAIATSEQGKGHGQQLINYGLNHLKSSGVELVFTYGDPNYYSKVGFIPISETVVKAPLDLSQPEGWLVQSLHGRPIVAMQGSTKCVNALNSQELW